MTQPPKNKTSINERRQNGFTLSEVLVTVGIIGTLSAISVPTYMSQVDKSCQSQLKSLVSQTMAQTQAYNDEFGTAATSWGDLDKIGTIMTETGPAKANNFDAIQTPGCNYKLKITQAGNVYVFNANQGNAILEPPPESGTGINAEKNKLNVMGCLNISTGASELIGGNGIKQASASELNCV
jgi:type IV pilus assembly protein PilA